MQEQILQAVTSLSYEHSQRRQLWVVPPAIAAGLLISFAGYSILHPPDYAELNNFVVNNWNNVVDTTSESGLSDTSLWEYL